MWVSALSDVYLCIYSLKVPNRLKSDNSGNVTSPISMFKNLYNDIFTNALHEFAFKAANVFIWLMDPLHETFSFFQLLVLVLQPKAKRAGTLGMNPVLSLPDVTNMQLFHVVYLLPPGGQQSINAALDDQSWMFFFLFNTFWSFLKDI